MYYHIRIDYFDKKLNANQTLYEYDYQTKEDVLNNIVVPHVTEKRIIFDGVILESEDRRQLRVYETDNDIKSMVDYANRNVSSGIIFVYHNQDLIKSSRYAKEITKELTQRALARVEELKATDTSNKVSPEEKRPLLFISHSSTDETIVTGLVELLRTLGFNNRNLFCSSVPGYDIPEGEDIYDFLQTKLCGHRLFVVYVLSESYYQSAACLNEMGAAWVLKAKYSTILLPGFNIPDIKGAVNPRAMAIVLEDIKRVRGKLNQFKDRLIDFFSLPDVEDDTIWENDRKKFIDIVTTRL